MYAIRSYYDSARFIELASEINSQMPGVVVGRVADLLNECMKDHGGFEHNLQSLRVVDELEQKYAES